MRQFQYTIQAQVGLHGRPAALLAREAKAHTSTITIEKAGKKAPATGLIALMTLGIRRGDTVTVTVEGGDEEAALQAMEQLFRANL